MASARRAGMGLYGVDTFVSGIVVRRGAPVGVHVRVPYWPVPCEHHAVSACSAMRWCMLNGHIGKTQSNVENMIFLNRTFT
jgi:hypothetical protein